MNWNNDIDKPFIMALGLMVHKARFDVAVLKYLMG
jgi:hypothetical protein